MDKVNKLGSAVSKKLVNRKTNKNNQSGGDSLEQIVRSATAKELKAPDAILNQKVVELIPSAMHTDGEKEVAQILTARLSQKNPHKVFLAICLIREVLKKCSSEIAPAREDIMTEVGKVASQPMNRFDSNLSDQQRTKHAAFELLKTYGQDGHILSQPDSVSSPRVPQTQSPATTPHHGGGATGHGNTGNQSLAHLLDTVQTQTVIAGSHNDLLQDMLLDKTSYEDKSPQDRSLAKDVIMDATKFGQSFEQLLGRLSAYDTVESNNAMTAAIEKMDILNNSLNLHKEMLTKELKGATGRPHASKKSSLSAGRQGSGSSNPTSPAASKSQNSGMGNLLELQQGLDAPQHPAQAAQMDPFAASNNWQNPSQPQNPQYGYPGQQASNQQQFGGGWPAGGPQTNNNYGNNYPGNSQGYGQQPQSLGYNPYQQGYGQQWGGPPSNHPAGLPQWGGPQSSHAPGPQQWGGPSSSHPHAAQQWGGPTSSHPGGQYWGEPQTNQSYGQQQWGGPSPNQGYGAQPYGFGGYGPPTELSQGTSGYGSQQQTPGAQSQEKPAHVPPPMREAVITVPAKTMPPKTIDKLEEIAASTPLSGAATNSGNGAQKGGVLEMGQPQSKSPEHPRTPAPSSFSGTKPASQTSTPVDSPPQLPQTAFPQPQQKPADDFGFESNAFSTPAPQAEPKAAVSQAVQHPTTSFNPAAQTPGQSSPAQGFGSGAQGLGTKPAHPVTFDAFGPSSSQNAAPAAAKQQSPQDDWDLFFNDKQSSGPALSGSDVKSKKPIDQLALAFQEMSAKQK